MKFVKCEETPRRRKRRNSIRSLIEEFVNMNVKTVKVEFREDEYKSAKSCRDSFAFAAKKYCFPVYAQLINGEVFLIRRDM